MKNNNRASAAGRSYVLSRAGLRRLVLTTLVISLSFGLVAGFWFGRKTVEPFVEMELDSFIISATWGDGMLSVSSRAAEFVKAEYGFDNVIDSGRLENRILPIDLRIGEEFTVYVTQTGANSARIWVDYENSPAIANADQTP